MEKVKLTDLIISSMNILELISRDGGLLQECVYHLQSPENVQHGILPFFLLQQTFAMEDIVKKASLSFIASCVRLPVVSVHHIISLY